MFRRKIRRVENVGPSSGRLGFASAAIIFAFTLVVAKASYIAGTEPEEGLSQSAIPNLISQRASVVDRNGHTLATNLPTFSIYSHPRNIISNSSAERIVSQLAEIFPVNEERLFKKLTSDDKFVWIRDRVSPEQYQAVHEIGEPGIEFGPRETRVYPNGVLAAHVLGGARYGRQGVNSAEVIGAAGVEKESDDFLRDPSNDGAPLVLSLDVTAQSIVHDVLKDGVSILNARAGSAILMDAHTGEVYAMVSLPDFDPNLRGTYKHSGKPEYSPLFNRAAQGVFELGSVFKIFAVAQALELGTVRPDTVVKTTEFRVGGHLIRDAYGPRNYRTVTEIITKSSNVGAARLALEIGRGRQQEFMRKMGFDRETGIEIAEANTGKPMWTSPWGESTVASVAYGYGVSVTPLHLAAGLATIVNGGYEVKPTILKRESSVGQRVSLISQKTSNELRHMLRLNVLQGTARGADIDGYSIGGKTGSANKLRNGKYQKNEVYAVFASFFPAEDPRFVLVTVIDEPKPKDIHDILAGNTVVPVAAEMLTRLAPVLGIRPRQSGEKKDA